VSTIAHPTRSRSRGFSLVEIMVAMVIGMFGIIVMVQVFALSEERKRTTTGGGDAMIEGVMSLYGLQRDIRMAGYGIGDTKVLGCNVLLRAGVTLNAMAPVTINHASITGQDANTDTLVVVYGNSNSSPQGDVLSAAGNIVPTPTFFAANDWVIEAPTRAAACALTLQQVAGVVAVAAGTGAVVTLNSAAAMTKGNTLFNLGQTFKVVAYAIRGGNLTLCDYMVNDCGSAANNGVATVWVPIANNIVSLRAQYGRDTTAPAMDGIVDVYDQTTPAAAAATTGCSWARVSAVRLVLVARSAQFEKTAVTTVAPEWEGTYLTDGVTVANAIDLAGNASWQNYRYKLFQTVVPVRNIAWMGVASGC
jgi:type IV pilus assembly protein PilW